MNFGIPRRVFFVHAALFISLGINTGCTAREDTSNTTQDNKFLSHNDGDSYREQYSSSLNDTTQKDKERSDVLDTTGRALEDQLSCVDGPSAGIAFRAMIKNKIIKNTGNGIDGSEIYLPEKSIEVFDFKVASLTGWAPEEPFSRGPGTSPPDFIAVAVYGTKDEVIHALKDRNLEVSDGWYSIYPSPTDADGAPIYPSKRGTVTITCNGFGPDDAELSVQ